MGVRPHLVELKWANVAAPLAIMMSLKQKISARGNQCQIWFVWQPVARAVRSCKSMGHSHGWPFSHDKGLKRVVTLLKTRWCKQVPPNRQSCQHVPNSCAGSRCEPTSAQHSADIIPQMGSIATHMFVLWRKPEPVYLIS